MKKFGAWVKAVYTWSAIGCFLGTVMFIAGFIAGCYFKQKEKEEEE